MATFLDLALMDKFSSIFVVIFVFAAVYALLESTNFLGKDNKNIRAILAFSLAILTLFSPGVVNLFLVMGPMFVIVFIFFVFLIMLIKMFGAEDKQFQDAIKAKDKMVLYWLIIISIIIMIIAVGKSFGQNTLTLTNKDATNENANKDITSATGNTIDVTEGSTESSSTSSSDGDNFDSNVAQAMFHPKVLGMMLTLFIGIFTVLFLTAAPKKFD